MALVLIFILCNFIGLQYRADNFKIPAQQQALFVIGNIMAVRTNNRLFPIHLWLLTAGVVGPVLLVLGSGIYNSNYFNNSVNIGVVLLFIPFGLVFSLPTFIVVWLAHAAVGQKLPVIFMKLLLMSIAIVGVFITFSLIGGSTAKTYSLFYAAGVVLSGMILRVETS